MNKLLKTGKYWGNDTISKLLPLEFQSKKQTAASEFFKSSDENFGWKSSRISSQISKPPKAKLF